MKFRTVLFLFLLLLMNRFNTLMAQVTTTPFTVTLENVTWSEWPGLHSFAHGEWDNRWLLLAGRTGGLHDLLPPTPFPVSQANANILVLDPATGEQWSSSVFSLPDPIRDQLRSTNPEYTQRGKYLYIVGGYGKDSLTNGMITFPSLLAVDLELLSDAVINGLDINPAFRQLQDTLFCVSGGEMDLLNNHFYLFGGHVFTGEYSKPAGPTFTQTYTNELRKFDLLDDGVSLTVSDVEQMQDTAVFHRRDLNMEPVVFPDESFGLAAYAGVFQYEADWVWYHPVYITESTYKEDTTFSQKFNAYTCPVMGIYDSVSQNYYATFFGGISQFYHDVANDTIKEDQNVPFVKDISTVIRYADGAEEQVLQPIKMEALLGSNAVFIPNDSIPHYANNIIQLHHIDGTVMAGYIFGGIDADFPNFTTSAAGNRLFKVWLQYEKPVGIINEHTGNISIFPNPAHAIIVIKNNMSVKLSRIKILNSLGAVVLEKELDLEPGEKTTISLAKFSSGIYFIKSGEEDIFFIDRFVKN